MTAALDGFLAATDLDQLADAYRHLVEHSADTADTAVAARTDAVLDTRTDRRGLVNLLLYPALLSPDRRAAELVGALTGDDPPLKLAAAVGAGMLPASEWAAGDRARLVTALAAAITGGASGGASDPEADGTADDLPLLTARRAAATLSNVTTGADAPALVPLLRVADNTSRHNIWCALLPLLGSASLRDLVDDPDDVPPADAAAALAAAAADGIDPDVPAATIRLLPRLPLLPNLDVDPDVDLTADGSGPTR